MYQNQHWNDQLQDYVYLSWIGVRREQPITNSYNTWNVSTSNPYKA